MTEVWKTKGAGAGMSSSLQMADREWRLMFKPGEWNSITRAGVYEAGVLFVRVWLPKRFTAYALTLGYNGKSRTPLVLTGRLRKFLLARAYPEARATSSNVSLIIRMPTPTMISHRKPRGLRALFQAAVAVDTGVLYTANAVVNRVIKTITNAELIQMEQQMMTTINSLVEGSQIVTSRKTGEITGHKLTTIQRSSIVHTTKPQGSLHAAANRN